MDQSDGISTRAMDIRGAVLALFALALALVSPSRTDRRVCLQRSSTHSFFSHHLALVLTLSHSASITALSLYHVHSLFFILCSLFHTRPRRTFPASHKDFPLIAPPSHVLSTEPESLSHYRTFPRSTARHPTPVTDHSALLYWTATTEPSS